MNRIKILFISVLIICASQLYGRQYPVINYDQERGLSNNMVRCIAQDKDGFIWFGTLDGVNRFDGRVFKIFDSENVSYHKLSNTSILSICVDGSNQMWVGTENGLYKYDSHNETFSRFDLQTGYGVMITGKVMQIVENTDGKIWIATESQGFFIYNPSTETLMQNSKHSDIITVIAARGNGNMFVGSMYGIIFEFNLNGELLRSIAESPSMLKAQRLKAMYYANNILWCGSETMGFTTIGLSQANGYDRLDGGKDRYLHVRAILPYSDNELLVGSDSGLSLYNTVTGTFEIVTNISSFGKASFSGINALFRDSEGGIWVAGQYSGVSYIPRILKPLQPIMNAIGSEEKRIVTDFSEDSNRNVWIATENAGLIRMASNGTLDMNPLRGVAVGSRLLNIKTTMIENDKLWIGTVNEGIFVYDIRTKSIKNYSHDQGNNHTINDNEIQVIFLSATGNIFAGTPWGLANYDPIKDCFVRINRGGNDVNVCDFANGNINELWIASRNKGGIKFDLETKKWNNYIFNPNHIKSGRPYTVCIFADSKGKIWLGTESGLFNFNEKSEQFDAFVVEGVSLHQSKVTSIEEDGKNRLWVSTGTGILCLDTQNARLVYNMTVRDGLQSNQFNSRASLFSTDGGMYFGSVNGFNRFYPDQIITNDFIPPIYITGLFINEKPVNIRRDSKDRSPLRTTITDTEHIILRNSQNSIGFAFAALSYQSPNKNKYAYKLVHMEKEWIYTDNNNVYYNNLSAGKYTFYVKGTNDDGVWTDIATIKVTVLQPFYKSVTAIILYIIVVALTVWLSGRYIVARHRKKMSEFAVEQDRLNYLSKINFFTNIAHEIRTPLSLIKIPLESIMKSGDQFSDKSINYLKIIEKNVGSLLEMVNQLLDLRKTEEIGANVNLSCCNVSTIVEELCTRFEPMLEVSNIALKREITPNLYYYVDRDAISTMVNNLLSNASKYAANSVTLRLMDEYSGFLIAVINDGRGVKPEDTEKIFTTFFQSDGSKAGTGIGLPLAKLTVEKLKGTIWCENIELGGVAFYIRIPINKCNRDDNVADQTEDMVTDDEVNMLQIAVNENAIPVILVVEDNDDLQKIIADLIRTSYSVLTASNGKQALEVLAEHNCNLVVSDIMMPEMDGYELCELLKNDMAYSHIPIIQLTAKASIEDKIKGLENGADAYIEKPFSPGHLMAQICSLLQNRNRIIKALTSTTSPDTKALGMSNKDSEFIDKLNREIKNHICEENFYIEDLAEIMFMSRSNFYRKIKSLFGMPPNDYLKKYRLKKAAEMIASGNYMIKEIYEQTGFKTSSYFSVCFKEEFGMTPKQYKDHDK